MNRRWPSRHRQRGFLINPYVFSVTGTGIAFRAATDVTFAQVTSCTINKPAGVIAGDVMLAHIRFVNSTSAGSWAVITPPSGWTQVLQTTTQGTWYDQMTLFIKIAGGSEPADYTWNWTVAPQLYAVAAEASGAGIVAYSGVDNSTPLTDTDKAQQTGNSNNVVAPSVDPVEAGSRLVCWFGGTSGLNAAKQINAPGSMVERLKRIYATSGYAMVTVADEVVGAGATGTRTATYDGASTLPSDTFSVILNPA